jgi:hypothetical protein
MTTRKYETACLVQAGIVRAISVLGDSLGISALAASAQTSAPSVYVRPQGCKEPYADFLSSPRSHRPWKVRGQNERRPKFTGTMDRSTQLKQNVSFCHKSARHNSGRGLLMEGFLRGVQ